MTNWEVEDSMFPLPNIQNFIKQLNLEGNFVLSCNVIENCSYRIHGYTEKGIVILPYDYYFLEDVEETSIVVVNQWEKTLAHCRASVKKCNVIQSNIL